MTYTENIRSARMEANGGSHTREEWEDRKRRQHYRCWNNHCKCDLNAPGVVTHKDHFIPVARGGTDNIKNIVALCGPCNMRKGKKTWDEFMEREILRQQFHGMGEHASDIGRAAYGAQGSAHFGAGGGSTTGFAQGGASNNNGGWSVPQFLVGVVKGAFVLTCGALFVGLLFIALVGNGKKRSGGGRLAEGAVGAFGLWRLSTWAFRDNSIAKGMGMAVGALAAAIWLLGMSANRRATRNRRGDEDGPWPLSCERDCTHVSPHRGAARYAPGSVGRWPGRHSPTADAALHAAGLDAPQHPVGAAGRGFDTAWPDGPDPGLSRPGLRWRADPAPAQYWLRLVAGGSNTDRDCAARLGHRMVLR